MPTLPANTSNYALTPVPFPGEEGVEPVLQFPHGAGEAQPEKLICQPRNAHLMTVFCYFSGSIPASRNTRGAFQLMATSFEA